MTVIAHSAAPSATQPIPSCFPSNGIKVSARPPRTTWPSPARISTDHTRRPRTPSPAGRPSRGGRSESQRGTRNHAVAAPAKLIAAHTANNSRRPPAPGLVAAIRPPPSGPAATPTNQAALNVPIARPRNCSPTSRTASTTPPPMNNAAPNPCRTRAIPTTCQLVDTADSSDPNPNTTIDVVSAVREDNLGTNRVPRKSTSSRDSPIDDTT